MPCRCACLAGNPWLRSGTRSMAIGRDCVPSANMLPARKKKLPSKIVVDSRARFKHCTAHKETSRSEYMNDMDLKRNRIEMWAKIGGVGALAFVLAPIIFITIKGLIGLIVFLALALAGVKFIPYFAMVVA